MTKKQCLLQAQKKLQQAARELERRMESSGPEFWGGDRPADVKLKDLPDIETVKAELPRMSEEDLQQYSSQSLSSLRSSHLSFIAH